MSWVQAEPDLHAHAIFNPAPQMSLAELRPFVVRREIGGLPTWELDPAHLLGHPNPQAVAELFGAWRSGWHTSFRLDPADNVRTLAALTSPVSAAWGRLGQLGTLDSASCASLLAQEDAARRAVARSPAHSVVLASRDRPGALRAWAPGTTGVIGSYRQMTLSLEASGIFYTCVKHRTDQVDHWALTPDGGVQVWVRCAGTPLAMQLAEPLTAALTELAPASSHTTVLTRPVSVAVARTLEGMIQASHFAISNRCPIHLDV